MVQFINKVLNPSGTPTPAGLNLTEQTPTTRERQKVHPTANTKRYRHRTPIQTSSNRSVPTTLYHSVRQTGTTLENVGCTPTTNLITIDRTVNPTSTPGPTVDQRRRVPNDNNEQTDTNRHRTPTYSRTDPTVSAVLDAGHCSVQPGQSVQLGINWPITPSNQA